MKNIDKQFHSPSGKTFTYKELLKEVLFYIKEEPQEKYKIVIGTDSANHGTTDFVSAIVVYREGHGGRFFWRRLNQKKIDSLRARIYQEVMMSLKLAGEVLLNLSQNKDIVFDFEVHVDIGSKGATRDMLQEIIGMVRGYGFQVKTKPESYGATKVADRYT
ncbi:MAG: ribonuclease H-like YkuK family protein [Candidatus Pacebacteria bacterium]|nr:ribonuclease H-like YkuK family protein [Candidatus Paceibacterota bacterium]MDD5721977.1 ribonuclease H-like YkuK family protein [Candidatus Paceibacterota bacterium]